MLHKMPPILGVDLENTLELANTILQLGQNSKRKEMLSYENMFVMALDNYKEDFTKKDGGEFE